MILSIYQSIFRVGQLEEKVAEFCEDTDASTLILPNGETPDSVAALMQCYNQPVSFFLFPIGGKGKFDQNFVEDPPKLQRHA